MMTAVPVSRCSHIMLSNLKSSQTPPGSRHHLAPSSAIVSFAIPFICVYQRNIFVFFWWIFGWLRTSVDLSKRHVWVNPKNIYVYIKDNYLCFVVDIWLVAAGCKFIRTFVAGHPLVPHPKYCLHWSKPVFACIYKRTLPKYICICFVFPSRCMYLN